MYDAIESSNFCNLVIVFHITHGTHMGSKCCVFESNLVVIMLSDSTYKTRKKNLGNLAVDKIEVELKLISYVLQ